MLEENNTSKRNEKAKGSQGIRKQGKKMNQQIHNFKICVLNCLSLTQLPKKAIFLNVYTITWKGM